MVLAVGQRSEPFATNGTAKGLQIQVGAKVTLEIAELFDLLIAHQALEKACIDLACLSADVLVLGVVLL